MLEIITQNKHLLVYLAWGSLILFVVSLAVIPWLIVRLPADYFHFKKRHTLASQSDNPIIVKIITTIKNMLGLILVILGFLMLVLPGQGILTILIGFILMNFPGKYKLERKIVSSKKVLNSLNWIRLKAKKPPFNI